MDGSHILVSYIAFIIFFIHTVVEGSNSLLELLAYCIIPSLQKLNGKMVQDSSLLVFSLC